jgi:hypothetical protein
MRDSAKDDAAHRTARESQGSGGATRSGWGVLKKQSRH